MYISTADFRAPFDPVDFQGLGAVNLTAERRRLAGLGAVNLTAERRRWPKRRSYWDTGNFRAPYDDGYFQNNQLFGVPSELNLSVAAPPLVRRFIASGEPVPTTLRDVTIPFNQVNRWVYALLGVGAFGMSFVAYRKWKKAKGKDQGSGQR